jgi:hypothetical protein
MQTNFVGCNKGLNMAQAQLIQGTGAELLPYLQGLEHRKNLMLIIPEADEPADESGADHTPDTLALPADTVFRNGVPLFPKREIAQPVTLDLVKRLAEED